MDCHVATLLAMMEKQKKESGPRAAFYLVKIASEIAILKGQHKPNPFAHAKPLS
jgi:hypothetical protein